MGSVVGFYELNFFGFFNSVSSQKSFGALKEQDVLYDVINAFNQLCHWMFLYFSCCKNSHSVRCC